MSDSQTTLATHAARIFINLHRLIFAQITPDLLIQQVSPGFALLIEDDQQQEIIGEHVTEVIEALIGMENTLYDILQGKLPELVIEYVNHPLPNGQTLYYNLYVSPINPQQLSDGLALLIEDVTKTGAVQQSIRQDRNEFYLLQIQLSKANEELRHLIRQKSIFASMVAHDLRGPLSVIRGFAEIVDMTLPLTADPTLHQYLQIVQNQAKRLDYMIANLLELDRIEQGILIIKPSPCEFQAILTDVWQTIQIAYADKISELSFIFDLPEEPLPLWCEYERIWQVFYNLISNAIKYSPAGQTITISGHLTDEKTVVQVIDTGFGMTAHEKQNLFELYYRTPDAKSSSIKGSGLGLFIAKTIIDAHHGQITVDSIPNEGTTFTVYLPTKRLWTESP